MTVIMPFVITMIFMIVVVIIVVAMIFIMVVMMIFVVILLMVIVMIMILVIITMIIDVNLAVEVFSLSPNQSGANGSFDCKRAAIAQAPLENATKKTIEGVMPWLIFEIVVETAMALDGENGREVEITSFKGFTRSTMGAMGFGRRNGCERAQQKSQQSKA